jgi:hypothetical protein
LDEVYLFRDFVYLQTLRGEMEQFLKSYALPTDICHDDAQWFAFLAAYANVIEDGSLSMKTDKSSPLGAVKEVTLNRGRTLTSEYHVNFVIQWNVELKDGRTVRVEMAAQPNDKLKMQSHGIQIINGPFVPPFVFDEDGNKVFRTV